MGDTKRCSTCHELRPAADFNVRQKAPDGLQSRCRACARAWYVENSVRHGANVRRRAAAVRQGYQQRIGEHLREHPCVDCGETDVRVLEFDHEPGSVKVAEVTRLVMNAGSWAVIEAEIAKCSVRCANCHRRVTAARAGTWRQRLALDHAAERREAAATRLRTLLG